MTAPSGPQSDTTPVVLVHGFAGSFEATWQRSGFALLLEESGRSVVGVDLLGHGTAPRPTDPAAYADLTQRIVDALPDDPVDAVGFSLGAATLTRLAARMPDRFRRLVLAGIGANVLEDRPSRRDAIIAAIQGVGDESDVAAQVFARYARQDGNDPVALVALLQQDQAPITRAELGRITCPVLVAIGDRDEAGPGDALVDALPHACLHVLPRTDHAATPESFEFFDAALRFLGAASA